MDLRRPLSTPPAPAQADAVMAGVGAAAWALWKASGQRWVLVTGTRVPGSLRETPSWPSSWTTPRPTCWPTWACAGQHRLKLHLTNPLDRLNGEIKRHSDVVGVFPNEAAVTRVIGALLLEQNDEWTIQRARYMSLETTAPFGDTPAVSLPPLAA